MKIQIASFLALVLTSGCALEGSGEIVTVSPDVDDPSRISVCCGFEVVVTQGEAAELHVTGDDNVLDALAIEQQGDTLVVERLPGASTLRPSQPVRVEATLSRLVEVTGSGGVQLTIEPFETEELHVSLSGGGRATIDGLRARELELEGSGGSEYVLEGGVESLDVSMSGGGDLDAFACPAETVVLELSGGPTARVAVSDALVASVSGGGDVTYRGSPEVTQELSGGSTLKAE